MADLIMFAKFTVIFSTFTRVNFAGCIMRNMKVEKKTVAVPGGNISVKSWIPEQGAEEPPLILLHDSLGSIAQWRDFPAVLAEALSRKVIAYDRLGFGQSSAREGLPSIDFVSEESTACFPCLKQALSIKNYVLLGHSVGGAMAITIAANDSDCDGVITISAQAFVEELTLKGIRQAGNLFSDPAQVEKLQKWHGDKAQWVLRAWIDVWLSPGFRTWSLDSCISHVSCPVLVIHGDQDEYGSNAFPRYIAENTSGYSNMVIIIDCGHMPHKENADEVLELIIGFLE